MRLIVGLGNPGERYARDRHNVGFRAVDALARELRASFNQKRAGSIVASAALNGERLTVAKPQDYMNLSGLAVQRLLMDLGVRPGELLVAHDDVDLPLGTLRLRVRGGPGTHNGMRSLVETLGTEEFPRLRMGIGSPPDGEDLRDYVLRPFEPNEAAAADDMIVRAVQAILAFVRMGPVEAMNRFNR